jgi:hypothetical protein
VSDVDFPWCEQCQSWHHPNNRVHEALDPAQSREAIGGHTVKRLIGRMLGFKTEDPVAQELLEDCFQALLAIDNDPRRPR